MTNFEKNLHHYLRYRISTNFQKKLLNFYTMNFLNYYFLKKFIIRLFEKFY